MLIVPCFFAPRGGEGLRGELDEKLLGFAAPWPAPDRRRT